MKMETRIAIQNMKYRKSKNVLVGIAVLLTTLLLFLVPTIGRDLIDMQFQAINEIYPIWHASFQHVDVKTVEKLAFHHDVTEYGVREDFGRMSIDTADVSLMYLDEGGVDMYRLSLEEGEFPQNENEIVVSKGILQALGNSAGVGDIITVPFQVMRRDGLDYAKKKDFIISGLIADSDLSLQKKVFTAFISEAFVKTELSEAEIEYAFLFRASAKPNATEPDVEYTINTLASMFGIEEGDISINDDYLMANYLDPSFLPVIIFVMLIIIFAAVITIYSIYYVNMPERVREFGRLKAIGATRRQIKEIVFREGFCISLIVIPFGLLAGTLLTKIIFKILLSLYANDNILTATIKKMVDEGRVPLFHGWIYLLAIGVTLITVFISLMKPKRIAARVSEIDAIRYTGDMKKKKTKKSRKSYTDITILRLSGIYLFGNKKNSIITIVSMGITGIFMMVIATVLSCANPKESANTSVHGQYKVLLSLEEGNKEYPEREWKNVVKNNPLTDELLQQIRQIDGIKQVSAYSSINVLSPNFPDDNVRICGVPEEFADELIDGITEGSVTYEDLKRGDGVIIDSRRKHWYPNLAIGDTISFRIDGMEDIMFDVKILGFGDYPIGFTNLNTVIMADEAVRNLLPYNANTSFHIFAEENYNAQTEQELKELIGSSECMRLQTWQEEYESWKSVIATTSGACYAFLGILGAICIMNIINTMINSVHVRKKEIGMMQAIGMTDGQLIRMLQQEGLFYTIGTLFLSVGIGSILGYPVFLYAKENGMFNISNYHYPFMAAIVVTVLLVLIQFFLILRLGRSVKKESLIERIRFSE